MFKAAKFIFYMELILRLRRSQEWLYPLGFFVIVVSLFPFVFNQDANTMQTYIPGCIWIAALLASLFSMEALFVAEYEEGTLEQLLLNPCPLPMLIAAKLLAQWVIAELPLILLTPLWAWLFQLTFPNACMLVLSLLLGTPALTFIGGLGAALSLGLRQQGILLGLLILPLVIPILIFGVNIVQEFQAGLTIVGPCAFLAGLSILAMVALPVAIAAALRITVDD